MNWSTIPKCLVARLNMTLSLAYLLFNVCVSHLLACVFCHKLVKQGNKLYLTTYARFVELTWVHARRFPCDWNWGNCNKYGNTWTLYGDTYLVKTYSLEWSQQTWTKLSSRIEDKFRCLLLLSSFNTGGCDSVSVITQTTTGALIFTTWLSSS